MGQELGFGIEFLGLWETLHNPNFNRVQFDTFKNEAGLNRFVMTPSKWIDLTGAIGIITKAGRYGSGTYAHSDKRLCVNPTIIGISKFGIV